MHLQTWLADKVDTILQTIRSHKHMANYIYKKMVLTIYNVALSTMDKSTVGRFAHENR